MIHLHLGYILINLIPFTMKTKKNYVIALAIVGGMLFLADAANEFNQDAQETALIKKKKYFLPSR